MPEKRRKFDKEFRAGAVRIVLETGKPIVQVARDLGVNEGTLGNWVARDREAREGTAGLSTGGDTQRPATLNREEPPKSGRTPDLNPTNTGSRLSRDCQQRRRAAWRAAVSFGAAERRPTPGSHSPEESPHPALQRRARVRPERSRRR